MSEHDKFCTYRAEQQGHGDTSGNVTPYIAPRPCVCQALSLARADEREKMAQQTQALADLATELVHTHAEVVDGEWGCCHDRESVNGTDWNGPADEGCDYRRIINEWLPRIAAARGEEET